ncbi:tyrosine-type recombinase/integrase [Streptomyces sp. NPDC058735]|uniref:tyrosine-type recombinase/integrase n=1 Tax=Streptomyces sp. NPDC058735 TaxID=3346616 RepID=UPI003679CFB9
MDSIGSHRLGALFETIAGTGTRRGEAVGLRWDDIDLTRRVIVVRQQLVQESGRKKNQQAPAPRARAARPDASGCPSASRRPRLVRTGSSTWTRTPWAP